MPERRKKTADQPEGVKVGIPRIPKDYGIKPRKQYSPWSRAEKRLERSHNYWVCTTRADGRPHAMPVWGFWLDGAFHFSTGNGTLKARNIARNPEVVIHLESGDDVVILEGMAERVDLSDKVFARRVDALAKRKYKMPITGIPRSTMFRVRPRVALAWSEKNFPKDATRWEFPRAASSH
jgi:nitroimidazol reductase NimA-like FMN-containing flavoprotein (pyridoxamine 5'-phosphate oxidase superfamily)